MALRVGKKVSLRRRVTPQRVAAAERRRASLRRTATSMIVLLILAVVGGGLYTWYLGQQKTTAIDDEPAPSRRVEFKPVRQDPNAPVGVAVQTITSPVKPGENASVSIRTNQLADCVIEVKYGEAKAADSGLTKKKADEFGMVSWAWTVAATTPEGTWPVRITCAVKKRSGMVEANLVVKAS